MWKVSVLEMRKLMTAVDKEGQKLNTKLPMCVKLCSSLPSLHPDNDTNKEFYSHFLKKAQNKPLTQRHKAEQRFGMPIQASRAFCDAGWENASQSPAPAPRPSSTQPVGPPSPNIQLLPPRRLGRLPSN